MYFWEKAFEGSLGSLHIEQENCYNDEVYMYAKGTPLLKLCFENTELFKNVTIA